VRLEPRDASTLTQLGFAYQLRWRETADASYLPRSELALRRAIRFGTEDADAVLGLGSLALIRHEFREGLAYGEQARRLLEVSGYIGPAPVSLDAYGAMLQWQIAQLVPPNAQDVATALSPLVLPHGACDVAALAAAFPPWKSRRSAFEIPKSDGCT